jgi:hypothetical protein
LDGLGRPEYVSNRAIKSAFFPLTGKSRSLRRSFSCWLVIDWRLFGKSDAILVVVVASLSLSLSSLPSCCCCRFVVVAAVLPAEAGRSPLAAAAVEGGGI